jgi:hypothetical protein
MITERVGNTGMGAIVKNAPNALIWAVAVCFVAVITAFTVLSMTGANTDDLRSFLNLSLNIAAGLFSGGALVVAGAAAKSAGNAEKSVNGELDKKIEHGVRRAIFAPRDAGTGEPGERVGD